MGNQSLTLYHEFMCDCTLVALFHANERRRYSINKELHLEFHGLSYFKWKEREKQYPRNRMSLFILADMGVTLSIVKNERRGQNTEELDKEMLQGSR